MRRNSNRKFCCQSPKWSQITITYKSSKGNVNIRNSLLRHAQQYQVTLPPFHLKESNLQLKLTPRAWTHFNFLHRCPMSIHTVAVAQGQDSAGPLILPVAAPLILLISFPQDLDVTCITSPCQYCETIALESVVVALPWPHNDAAVWPPEEASLSTIDI